MLSESQLFARSHAFIDQRTPSMFGGFSASGGSAAADPATDDQGQAQEISAPGLWASNERTDIALEIRKIQTKIAAARKELQAVWAVVKRAMQRIQSYAVPKRHIADIFMQDSVVPRVRAIINAVDRMIRAYCTPPFDPPIDSGLDDIDQLDPTKRKSNADAWDTMEVPKEDTTVQDRTAADDTFNIMMGVKIIRILVLIGGLWFAQRAYAQLHARTMVSERGRQTPPPLEGILFTALAFDAFVQMVTLFIIVLISFSGRTATTTFLLDDQFIQTFLIEYFESTLLLIAFGWTLARLAQHKRYFDLANDGENGSKAYRDIVAVAAIIICIVPFYIILH